MLMQTPAKGSPPFKRTKRMSPTFAASGFVLEKRDVRAPVGSRSAIWSAQRALRGSLVLAAGKEGAG
jgi:hypothetical protein